jgi:hypothetical protein
VEVNESFTDRQPTDGQNRSATRTEYPPRETPMPDDARDKGDIDIVRRWCWDPSSVASRPIATLLEVVVFRQLVTRREWLRRNPWRSQLDRIAPGPATFAEGSV